MSREIFCEECLVDPQIVCKRDPDVRCLHCGHEYCGGHILSHLKTFHCVAVDNDHARKPRAGGKRRG
jgi:hypothetical protein